MDGQAVVQLAKDVVKAMNENSWANFGDVYLNNEKGICKRSYEKNWGQFYSLIRKEL